MQKFTMIFTLVLVAVGGCKYSTEGITSKQDDAGSSSTTDAVTATPCTPETAVEKCGGAAGNCVLPECTEYPAIGTFACYYVPDPRCAPPAPQSDAGAPPQSDGGTIQEDGGLPQSDAGAQSDATPIQTDAQVTQSDAMVPQQDSGVPFSSTCTKDSDCAPRAGTNVYGVCCTNAECKYFRVGDPAQCVAIQQDGGVQNDATPVQSDAAPTSTDGGTQSDATPAQDATPATDAIAPKTCGACVAGTICDATTGLCSVKLKFVVDTTPATIHLWTDTGESTVAPGSEFYLSIFHICNRQIWNDADQSPTTPPVSLHGDEFRAENGCWSGDSGCSITYAGTHLHNCTSGTCAEVTTTVVHPCTQNGASCWGGSGNQYFGAETFGLNCGTIVP